MGNILDIKTKITFKFIQIFNKKYLKYKTSKFLRLYKAVFLIS